MEASETNPQTFRKPEITLLWSKKRRSQVTETKARSNAMPVTKTAGMLASILTKK